MFPDSKHKIISRFNTARAACWAATEAGDYAEVSRQYQIMRTIMQIVADLGYYPITEESEAFPSVPMWRDLAC